MAITFGDYLIDSGYRDITPEQEREIEARGPQPDIYAEQSRRIEAEIERDRQDRQPCGRINAPCKDGAL